MVPALVFYLVLGLAFGVFLLALILQRQLWVEQEVNAEIARRFVLKREECKKLQHMVDEQQKVILRGYNPDAL